MTRDDLTIIAMNYRQAHLDHLADQLDQINTQDINRDTITYRVCHTCTKWRASDDFQRTSALSCIPCTEIKNANKTPRTPRITSANPARSRPKKKQTEECHV